MIRQLVLTIAAGTMVGCSSNGSLDLGSKEETSKNVAFAASTKMPTTSPSMVSGTAMAAIISGSTLKIYNFSNMNLMDAAVWVNGMYVTKVDTIPAMSEKNVDFSQFYTAQGTNLNTDKTEVKSVSVMSGSSVYGLLGPMMD